MNIWKVCAGLSMALGIMVGPALGAGNAEKGKELYMVTCTACHNADPAQPGAIGPAVKGSSQALLAARILKGAYPAGYKPKRRTRIMPPYEHLKDNIADIAAFLK